MLISGFGEVEATFASACAFTIIDKPLLDVTLRSAILFGRGVSMMVLAFRHASAVFDGSRSGLHHLQAVPFGLSAIYRLQTIIDAPKLSRYDLHKSGAVLQAGSVSW